MSKLICIVAITLLFFNCKKENIILIVPNIKIVEDISINTSNTIKSIRFVDSNYGFALSNSGDLYQTVDGGKNWNLKSFSVSGTIKDFEILDKNNAVCLIGSNLYTTDDAFVTLTQKTSGVSFIGKDNLNRIIYGISNQSGGVFYYDIYGLTSTTSFGQSLGNIVVENNMHWCKVRENIVIVSVSDDFYNDKVNSLNLSTGIKSELKFNDNLTLDDSLTDFAVNGSRIYISGKNGMIHEGISNLDRTYTVHTNTFLSMIQIKGIVYCSGFNSFVSNIDIDNDNDWNEYVHDIDTPITEGFYDIFNLNDSDIIVSGENGLIYKLKL
jgi:hypothetical protein